MFSSPPRGAEEPVVFFELVNGRTEQTNKDATFRAVPDPENQQRVNIFLAKALEYEKEWGGTHPAFGVNFYQTKLILGSHGIT